MRKIITVTANTAIDLNICIDKLNSVDNIIAHSSQEFSAGKGINVAKALESLACPSIALGFVGQQSPLLFEQLKSDLLTPDFIPVIGKTRTNLTLRELKPNKETHIRTAGFSINPSDYQQLHQKLHRMVQQNDIVIFSGSVPNGAAETFYPELITLCRQQRATVIFDSSGKNFAAGIQAQPEIIKPNLSELQEFIGSSLPDSASIIQAAGKLIANGIKLVVVSRGKLGALLVTADTVLSAHIESIVPNINSTIGCGDALVAGLAYALLNNLNLEAMLKLSVSCATANLFSLEPGRFAAEAMENFTAQTVLHYL